MSGWDRKMPSEGGLTGPLSEGAVAHQGHPPEAALPALRLTEEQIGLLRREGEVRPVAAGEVLFREGDRTYEFIVILAGRVVVVDHQAGTERELAAGGPGDFVAELNLLTGERLFTTAVVTEPGEVLAVPVARLQAVIAQDQGLGQWIIRAMFARRQWLMDRQTGLRIIGSRSSPQTRRLLEFAVRNRLPHVWLDTDSDPAADAVLAHHQTAASETPVVVMRGGELLRRPSNAELARAAGVGTGPAADMTYDVAIIGAGPAGLAAAVYGASEGLSTALVDALAVGGQIGTTSRIENYLGFPVGITGGEFAERAYIQVLRFGASVVLPAAATGLSGDGTARVIHLDTGDSLTASSVIIATGVTYRKIDAAGLDRFTGLGVYYSPLGVHDEIRPGTPVVIVGGGNSAGQAAIWLAGRGHRVTIVIRGSDLAENMSRYLIDRIAGRADIEVRYHSVVRALDGSQRLERIEVEDLTTATRETWPAAALVVLVGAEPHTGWLAGSVLLDDGGYIITGPGLGPGTRYRSPWTGRDRDPYLLETSAPGVFAAGDVRSGSVKRAAAAVGEGSIAVRFVSEHLGRRAGFATPAPAG
jgi:thioredoxin reductase (NADPH)